MDSNHDFRHRALILALFASAFLTGCQSRGPAEMFAQQMGVMHNVQKWWGTEAIQMDVDLEFTGMPNFNAHFVFETNGPRVRCELPDDVVIVYDGRTAWISPADTDMPMARFHVLTWPWFMVTPFKLSGGGVILEDNGDMPLDHRSCPTVRMTFEAGEGDTPDDWYVLYADPHDYRLLAQSYIVTYGKSVEQAEDEPHAIRYGEFRRVDGVFLPMDWTFWNWNDEDGIYGDQLGRARISNVRFVKPNSGMFDKPEDAKMLPAPGDSSRGLVSRLNSNLLPTATAQGLGRFRSQRSSANLSGSTAPRRPIRLDERARHYPW